MYNTPYQYSHVNEALTGMTAGMRLVEQAEALSRFVRYAAKNALDDADGSSGISAVASQIIELLTDARMYLGGATNWVMPRLDKLIDDGMLRADARHELERDKFAALLGGLRPAHDISDDLRTEPFTGTRHLKKLAIAAPDRKPRPARKPAKARRKRA